MAADQPIVIEGIHGLNDELTESVPRELKFKIYVSALTMLNLDDHNRIHTTDARLLGASCAIISSVAPSRRAPSPCGPRAAGEEKYIFPYQEQADAMFNSALPMNCRS